MSELPSSTYDSDLLSEINSSILEDSNSMTKLIDDVVKKYSSDLDELMRDIHLATIQESAISTDLVERYYADLSSTVYFMCERIEQLNILSDISKAKFKEKYNSTYINISAEKDERGKSIRTINENTALAENTSRYESVLSIVYDQAYRTLKMKVDMATEMISTLKHILKRRAQEEYMNFSISSIKPGKGDN